MNMMPMGSKAAIYIRTASLPPLDGIAEQYAEAARVIDRYALNVVGTYRDLGVSGTITKGREALERMIADIGPLGINVILVSDVARLSRGGLTRVWALLDLFREKEARVYVCRDDLFFDTYDQCQVFRDYGAPATVGNV